MGLLGLTPEQFFAYTPREIVVMVDGYHRRLDMEFYKMSVVASWLTSPHVKKQVPAHKFYQPEHVGDRSLSVLRKIKSEMDKANATND